MTNDSTWPKDIFNVLKQARIRQASYVPDGGHSQLIELFNADSEIQTTPLTTEEEGVALAAGAWLGGQRAVLLLQSSGVGNCINMHSLAATCRFPLLMLVTMRGEWAEFNPWGRHGTRHIERPGVDGIEKTLEVINGTTAFNGQLRLNWATKVLKGDISAGFTIDLAHKDLSLILDAANKAKLPLPVAAAARELFSLARAGRYAQSDFSAMIDVLCDIAGLEKPRYAPQAAQTPAPRP